jgi:hypothetical protein
MPLTLFRFEVASPIDCLNSFYDISSSVIGIYIWQCARVQKNRQAGEEKETVFWQLVSCSSHLVKAVS